MIRNILIKLAFDGKTRRNTWRKLATYMKNQVPQRKALSMIRDRYLAKKSILANLFIAIIEETDKGESLDVALKPWIPHEEVMLLRGGVKSSRLPEAFLDCASLIEARGKIVGELIGAISYPLLLFALFMVLIIVLSFFVMPELAQLSNPALWTGAAGLLYSFCAFVTSPMGVICFVLAIALVIASIVSLPVWTGKTRLLVENIPPWSIYRLIVGSVWLFTMATLLKAGIQLDVILTDMLNSRIMRPWLTERVSTIKDRYRSEGNFGTILLHLNMNFPDEELVEELGVYATFPDFHISMYKISKEWLEEGVVRVSKQARVINGVLLCGIIGLVCGLGIAIGSMQEQLHNSMGGF